MKNIRLITASLFVLALFSISAFAQATQTGKVFVINTYAFSDEKEGITKFVNASKQIETELQPRAKELQTMQDKMQTMAKEIQNLRTEFDKAPPGKSPIKAETIQAKYDDLEKMQIDYKRKEEDAKKALAKRSTELLDPIKFDIRKVMQDFAKQKGYPIILDLAAMDEQNIILAIGDDKVDVTKEFVVFYNARPAGAASATR